MKIKLNKTLFVFRKNFLSLIMRTFVFSCVTVSFGLAPNNNIETGKTIQDFQQQIAGSVTDVNGQPLAGANIIEKGTRNGVQVDFDGKFAMSLSNQNAILVVSYLGFVTKEVPVNNQTNIDIVLEESTSVLDEVVVVGYGVQKKENLTAAVAQVGAEVFENRPVANTARSLQGSVAGLVITNSSSGGEPGADSNINIRGFITSTGSSVSSIGDSGPLILVDGVEMNLNDIDPESIESVSVLKDAAAASIYGAKAAGGAILVITKNGGNMKGKVSVSYSTNYALTQPTKLANLASPINFAYAVNDSRINNNQNPYHDATDLANIMANMANPGSAPSIVANSAGTNWSYSAIGIDATGSTDWNDIIYKDWAERTKHNLTIRGGDQKLNFFISAGAYDEGGLLAAGNESFQRYNLDAKISAQVNDWFKIELLTKVLQSSSDFPTEVSGNGVSWNKSRVLDLISKIKPTLPLVDPIYGEEYLQHSYFPFWDSQRYKTKNSQLVLAPRFIIEPLKDLKLNVQLNYKKNNNYNETIILTSQIIRPAGFVDKVSQENTSYSPNFLTNDYFSPNIFTTYDKSIGNHNVSALVGYQSEVYNFHNLGGQTDYLTSDKIVSINASLDDDQLVSESISHLSNQSVFSRFRYNYKEKYLFEFSYRTDGSSKFEPENRWSSFPSYSAGYNIAKEGFWPLKDISTFKLRGSYGTLGNQNVPNYLYLTSINTDNLTNYLFDGGQETFASTPSLESQSLSWETVQTTDIGFDVNAFNNKLGIAFSWYRTDTEGMAAQSLNLPAQLGTNAPLANIGTSRVQGWEVEATWQQRLGEDFSYNVRAVLSDYKRTIVDYPTPDGNSLTQQYYPGKDLGEIYGLTWDGWFLTDEEAANYPIDQSAVTGWTYTAGDTKYKDLDGDGSINRGEWEVGDSGDWSVLGNTTPRYQYSINLGFTYKNFDFNTFIQGVGKRDVVVSNHQRFRGPGQGPFHANVWEEHLDYFRPEDTTNPLGPNLDAYFPAPYSANPGRNNKNYSQIVDRYIQNGAYARLKSLQMGYTIPKYVTSKYKINNIRIYVTGENLFTISDMLFFDPENVTSNVAGSAISYPLSRIVSMGLNVSF